MDDVLEECPEDKQYCFSMMQTDWFPGGVHNYTIRRGCAEDNSTEIIEGETLVGSYKDAVISCEDSSCNDGTDVINYYTKTTPSNVNSCHGCRTTHYLNGSIAGFPNCDDTSSESNLPVVQCPVYAQNSCTNNYYSAVSDNNGLPIIENITYQFVRACSPFFRNDDYENIISGISYTVTRESCTTDKCNVDQSTETCR